VWVWVYSGCGLHAEHDRHVTDGIWISGMISGWGLNIHSCATKCTTIEQVVLLKQLAVLVLGDAVSLHRTEVWVVWRVDHRHSGPPTGGVKGAPCGERHIFRPVPGRAKLLVCVCVCVFTCGGIHRNQHIAARIPPHFKFPKSTH
jgi:hypothetical protein